MSITFVDSSILIAAASPNDVQHETGREILSGIDTGELPIARLSNYIVSEVLNYIHTKSRHSQAVEFYNRLVESRGFEIVHSSRQDYSTAIDIFEENDRLSFVDAATVAYMRREALTYIFSLDADFDGVEGIVRLNVPENPYG